MKIKLLLFLLAFACFACHGGKVKQAGADSLLIGKWVVSETIRFQNNDDSISMKCNACPSIAFADDETGTINGADKQIFTFKWELDSAQLIIKHTGSSKDSDNFISDGTYQLLQNGLNTPREITLTDTAKDIKYILKK